MPRAAKQLNIRSTDTFDRVHAIAARTGRSASEVVAAAVQAFADQAPVAVDGLYWKNGILVGSGTRRVTHEEVQDSIDETREGVRD